MNRRGPSLGGINPADAIMPATALGRQPPSGHGQIPRLPTQPFTPSEQPFTPVAPPVPQPIAGNSPSLDYEANTSQILPFIKNAPVPIYSTKARWRAVDVYIELPQGLPTPETSSGTLSVLIYARSQQGARVIVGSGRMGPRVGLTSTPYVVQPVRWVAGARAVAETFDVVVQYSCSFTASVPVLNGFTYRVTTVASDQAVDLPRGLGTMSLLQGPQETTPNDSLEGVPPVLELVGVSAVNAGSDPRYLHLHDNVADASLDGLAPLWFWPLGTVEGGGVVDDTFRYRAVNQLRLVTSSTAKVTTFPDDAAAFFVAQVR